MKRILVADDEKNMCLALKMLLEDDGFSVITASNGREAIKQMESGEVVDLIISDLKMLDVDGMGILRFLRDAKRDIPLVLITAYGTIEGAVEAMKNGAADFITKPFNKDVIRHIIRRIFQVKDLENENKHLKESIRKSRLIYRSKAMKDIMETVKKISQVATPVLISGKSGSGKELIAEAIHISGSTDDPKYKRPFIKINCPANIQPKLLRLLEEKCFEPLGSTTTIKINARIICATNRELKPLVEKGLFREDLFYRINTITINIPPLRDRREDIMPLSEFFLNKYAREMGKNICVFSEEVKKALLAYPWPGNVRELRNVVERSVVLSCGEVIGRTDIIQLESERECPEDNAGQNKLTSLEKKVIADALKHCNGNVSAAAKEIGISRNTLKYRIKKYNLSNGGK